MSESESSSSTSAAASRKRAPSPPAAQSAGTAASPALPHSLHSSIAPPPPKKARCGSPPKGASSSEANAGASTGPAAPVAPRWSDLSPAQRCFSDGLALAFGFLSLSEVVGAAASCKAWREASKKANVAGVSIRNILKARSGSGPEEGIARLQSLTASPFCRHVRALTHSAARSKSTKASGPAWGWSQLKLLQQLPQLRRIRDMRIDLAASTHASNDELAFTFPPLLQSVDLHLSFDGSSLNDSDEGDENEENDESDESLDTAPLQRLVLTALRPCHSLTGLSITLRPWTALCLDGLLELLTLRVLMLDIEYADEFGLDQCTFHEEQISVVKQLPNLRRLKLIECDELNSDGGDLDGWLRWLCSLPHKLQQLQELGLSQLYLRAQHVQLLQLLPALTALEPASMYESAFRLLPSFADRLRRLKLRVAISDEEAAADPDLFGEPSTIRAYFFLPHLIQCSRLTHLTLCDTNISRSEATALCRALQQLTELDLQNVGWTSLEPLRHLPRLESFSLQLAWAWVLRIDVDHFEPLQQLRRLHLSDMDYYTMRVEEDIFDALRPPSALLPGLEEFSCTLRDM